MPNYICVTCGAQQAASKEPPAACIICEDDRQYVPPFGQQWTTLEGMKAAGHENRVRPVRDEPGLWSIDTRPRFAIGQRALLVQTPTGNLLWDCVSYLDEATVERIRELGGIAGISVSHPHFYASMIEFSRAFDGAPVYVPEADRQWVVRQDEAIEYYEGSHEVLPGMTLVQTGGHFEGSAALHWAAGAGGRGALFTGDTISVVADRRWVTFMRSYPNYIPLSREAIEEIIRRLEPYEFDRVHGGWWEQTVERDGKAAIKRSAERYYRWIERRAD
ncbi:MAG: MBL fold metallo-hydrolase [Chloroflexi bacterium]|nr:MAG: MBL fold metallo-hydrolase [Chloroflexota bacterium]